MTIDPNVECKVAEKLLDKRRLWEPEWRDLADFVVPRKAVIIRNMTAGTKTTTRIFSSVAPKSAEDLAATMMGTLTSPAVRWFTLVFPFAELQQDQEATEWLDSVTNILFEAFNQSNFSSEFQEAYVDLAGFGLACLYLTEADGPNPIFNGFRFQSLSVGEYCIAENRDGMVDTLYRWFKMPARLIVDRWGTKAPDKIREAVKNNNPYEEFELLNVVKPRKDAQKGTDVAPNKRPWTDSYIEISTKTLLEDGGYYEFPFMVPRWSKNSKEEYGRGPGHLALPDVKTLNRARELKFRQWAKVIDPPMAALDRAVIGTVRLFASGLNFVREKDALRPIESGARFDVAAVNEEELRQAIKEVFFADLTSLPPVQGTPMSATEAAQRFEIMERKLGPTIGRIKRELLSRAIDRGFAMMLRAKAFPQPPPSVVEFFRDLGKIPIQVKYEGPLEQAQEASEVAVIERTYAQVAAVASVYPEAADVLDHDGAAIRVAQKNGFPQHLIRTQQQIADLRQARAEQAQQQAILQQLEQGASALQKGASGARDLHEIAATPPPNTGL